MSSLNFSKFYSTAFALIAIAMLANMLTASAADDEHFSAAKGHAQEALKHGEMGHADLLADHAGKALVHAKALKASANDEHYDAVVSELENAVEHGNKGHAKIATEHAKMALQHIENLDGHHQLLHEPGHHAGEDEVKPHKH